MLAGLRRLWSLRAMRRSEGGLRYAAPWPFGCCLSRNGHPAIGASCVHVSRFPGARSVKPNIRLSTGRGGDRAPSIKRAISTVGGGQADSFDAPASSCRRGVRLPCRPTARSTSRLSTGRGGQVAPSIKRELSTVAGGQAAASGCPRMAVCNARLLRCARASVGRRPFIVERASQFEDVADDSSVPQSRAPIQAPGCGGLMADRAFRL